jgi:hypothetical protein
MDDQLGEATAMLLWFMVTIYESFGASNRGRKRSSGFERWRKGSARALPRLRDGGATSTSTAAD